VLHPEIKHRCGFSKTRKILLAIGMFTNNRLALAGPNGLSLDI
jgi:hypothetical protein